LCSQLRQTFDPRGGGCAGDDRQRGGVLPRHTDDHLRGGGFRKRHHEQTRAREAGMRQHLRVGRIAKQRRHVVRVQCFDPRRVCIYDQARDMELP
jgi:hypothetical protein